MFTLMGSFWEKYILFELKRHRGVIFHDTDTEEWCKIWSGINLLFQNWHEEFVKLWPEYSKVLKFFNLKGSFRARYTLFEVKKHRKVMQSLERNWLVASKLTWGICPLLTQVLESFQKFSFTGFLLCKVYIVWARKVQRGYLSRHWRVIHNLERNWLVASKLI